MKTYNCMISLWHLPKKADNGLTHRAILMVSLEQLDRSIDLNQSDGRVGAA